MNSTHRKRLFTILLSLLLTISMLPAGVFADITDGSDDQGQVVTEQADQTENPASELQAGSNDGGDSGDPSDADEAAPKREVQGAESGAKGPENEGEDPPAKDGEDEGISANILDFIPPGTITMIHTSDNSPVTTTNPARPGETVLLALTNVGETINGLQFDMHEMSMNIPAGLVVPEESETDTSNVQVTDYSVHPQQTYGMQNTYVIGADGKIRYIWNQSATEERPPESGNIVDVYQLACNAENFKYSLSFEMTVGDDADSIVFDNGISFPVDRSVALKVKKDIEIPGMSSISQTQAQQMTFALYYEDGVTPVKDKNGNDITFTRNDMTGSGLTGAEWNISGLTSDTYPAKFVVKETGHPDIEGYTFLEAGTNVVTEQLVEIPAGQSGNAWLKNIYTKDTAKLKVKKAFPAGDVTNPTTSQKNRISFKVKDSDGNVVASATLSDTTKFNANGEWNVGSLAPGTYTVEETADLDGYTRTTTYKVDTNAATEGDSASVTLVTDGEHVVEFDNVYTRQDGTLKIQKFFAGATDSLSDADKNKIKFDVTDPDGNVIHYTYADFTNGVLTIDPALAGTWKVVESNTTTTNYSVTTTYTVNGTSGSGSTANVAVPNEGTGEVDYTNTYTELGKITLTKTVGGNYWDDFGTSYDTQRERRYRIRNAQYILYRVNDDGTRTQVGNTLSLSSFYTNGTYTGWNNLPVGNYEIDEVMTNTNSSAGSVISNTTRTTTVTVNGGTPKTTGPVEGGNTVKTGSFSVTKGGTSTVAYQNDYNKKQGKIKLDKEVWIDGVKVTDWSTLTEAQQKAMKFKITGTDVYGKSESKEVSLYDILNHQNGVGEDGYITIDYSNSTGYTVTESGADLANYIRVTTRKLDNGEFGAGASIAAVKINDTTTSHTVTFKNEYSSRGRLKVDKTIEGLSAADATTVSGQIWFTIVDTNGRPIVKDANGRYVLGQASDTAVHIPLSELTDNTSGQEGIELPTGTYILTEHNGEFNEDVYTWSVSNVIINDGQQVDPRQNATSGNAPVTLGDTVHVQYTNTYTRNAIGPGGGVSIIKHVLLQGVEIDASYSGVYGQIYNTVIDNIRFKIYEGTEVNDANLIEGCPEDGYSLAQLQRNPPILYVGTYTIQETNYNVPHYTHAMYFTVNGATTRDDHVTITVTQNQHVNVEVYNGYIPLGDLEVHKVIDESGDLKAADLTPAQKQAIKFSVIGYKDTSKSEVVWPEQEEGATEPQPYEFTYADMTLKDGVMSKVFNDIPIGVYVVEETKGNHDGDIPNYNVYTVEDPAGNALEVHWNTSGNETAVKTFTNKYTRQKGNLEVTKTFDAPSTLTTADRRKIKFTVYDSAGNVVKEFTYAQMTGGTYTINDLETGTYTIKETNADFDYFERTTTVNVNGGDDTTYNEDNGVNASVTNNATASVHFTNEYQERGALIINKTFDDSECINKLTVAQKNAVKFTIKRVKADGTTETIKTITYAQILAWITQHPSQSPVGYRMLVLPGDYIIEESNADFTPDYVRSTTVTVIPDEGASTEGSGDSATATIDEFHYASVVFDNKYNELGKLKVQKTVEDLELNDAQKAAIKFTVTQGNNVIAEFTYADILAAPNHVYVIENLPAGDYVVTETVENEASVFYGKTRRTFVKVGTGGETENRTATATVDKTEDDNIVIFRNKYGNTDQLTVQKEVGGAPTAYIEKGDSLYPVWKFNLKISNLEPSTTNNGTTDIIDYIDNKALLGLFEVVTNPADLALIDAKDPGATTIANKLTTTEAKPTATVTLEEDYDQGKVTFHITGITAQTATSNDLFYYLIPKNAAALETLNAREGTAQGTPSNQLKKYFSNVAEYKKLPLYDYVETNKVDYEYEKLVVKKSILNLSTTGQLTDEYGNIVNVAEYEFIINPEEMKLSNDGYIDVTDTFSTNQSVDQESITVERCVYDKALKKVVSTSPAQYGDVTYKDLSGNKILLTLKDEICFRVTYTATLLYTAEELETGDPLNLNNMVEVEGYKDGIQPVVLPSSEGGGSVYRIRLRKYETGNLDNPLKGAEFKMYLDEDAAEAAKASGDYSQAIGTYTTDKDGVITITSYTYKGGTHNVAASTTYYFVESVAPAGYEKINYVVHVTLAAEGQTANYDQYIYLPSDTVGIKDTPFDTSVDLGALKTFTTNESARRLNEDEFSFKIKAVDNAPMPTGATGGEITVSNDAAGKAIFGTIPYDTEDVITRDKDGNVTGTEKTFHYQVSEVLPDGVTAQNPTKDGVHYDTHTYDVAVTVAVSANNSSLNVTSVTVDNTAIQPNNNVYFVGATNTYTAQGTWTPNIQKDLQGRTLEAGEFTFEIKKGDTVLATGTNNADGTVSMTPASIEFTLADLGVNNLTVHEVYTIQTNDGIYSTADNETVKVTVAEKQDNEGNPVYDGKLNVTSDKATLTAPLVMTNKFKASGSWNPKAKKVMSGGLKINAGDYSFELAAVGDAPMPAGSTDGKKEVACDANGEVDFGQINFYQGNFDNVEYNNGNKVYQYKIKEIIPDPPIFGVTYDETEYTVTVTTSINKTNKLGVAVDWTPKKDGTSYDSNTAVFTGRFNNTYYPGPTEAIPQYKKTVDGEKPPKDVEFTFKLEKYSGDFDYVKVGNGPFDENGYTETATITKTTDPPTVFGSFDEISFLAQGTYKFKITETPNTNGALDERFVYDTKVYIYTVVVTGVGTQLQATGTYTVLDKQGVEQPVPEGVTMAEFTNTYTPKPVTGIVKVKKTLVDKEWTTNDSFEFTITPIGNAPKFTPNKVTVTKDSVDYTESFNEVTFESAGTYKWTVTETHKGETINGITYDSVDKTVTIVVQDTEGGELELVKPEGSNETIPTAEFTNTYDAAGSIPVKGTKKYTYGSFDKETFTFSIYTKDDFDRALDPYGPLGRIRDRNDPAVIAALQGKAVMTASTAGLTVGEDGKVAFDFKTAAGKDLEYVLADIKGGNKTADGHWTKTFTYVVVEDIPAEAKKKTVNGETFYYLYDKATDRDVKYDATVHTMTITVTDNGDGTLEVTSDPGGKQPSFGFVNEKIYTKIKLTKLIDELVDGDTEDEPINVTFVFKVKYTDPILGRKVNRTVSVQFDASSNSSDVVELDKIPIEAKDLEVTEVYAADYNNGTVTTLKPKKVLDEDTGYWIWIVTFENKRSGNITGSGVINSVEKNEDGFVITNRVDSTGNNPPPSQPAQDYR